MDFVMMMWHKAAMEALLELKKEKIKEKLAQVLGPAIDKGADAVIDAMHKKITAAVQGSASEQELRAKLSSIMSEVFKK
jgi:hypothetical protein